MIYHEANLSENEASIAQGQGQGQILRGQSWGQKIWPWGRAGLEDLTSQQITDIVTTNKIHKMHMIITNNTHSTHIHKLILDDDIHSVRTEH